MGTARMLKEGDRIDHTPSSDVAMGDVVVQSELVAIATEPIASGVLGSLAVKGIFQLPKDTSTAFAIGDHAYWDVGDGEIQDTDDTGTNKLAGKIVEVAAEAAATCKVLLTP